MATDWGGIISTAIGGTAAVAENLFGKNMVNEADKREAALGEAPEFSTPQSQTDYEALMKSKAGQDMPGYTDMLNQVEASTAYQASAGARASGSQYGAMAAGNAAQSNRRRYLRQLGIQNDVSKSSAKLDSTMAGASGTQFDIMAYEYNDNIPWQMAKNEIAALRGYGQQKIVGGLDNVGATGIYASQIYGNNNKEEDGGLLPPTA